MGHHTVFLKKQAGPAVVGPLTTFFQYLSSAESSARWMEACNNISVVQRRQPRSTKAKKYWPISLTSCVARVKEKLLNAQFLNYLQDQSLICDEQAGFLPGVSTVTQLCFLINRWHAAIDRGEGVEAIFLDLSKAYDGVSIPGLIYKLSRVGFPSSFALVFLFLDGPPTASASSWICVTMGNSAVGHTARHCAESNIVPTYKSTVCNNRCRMSALFLLMTLLRVV